MNLESLDRKELEALLGALEERDRRIAAAPLLGYNPHPKQTIFHRSECRRRAVFGANRSGKTLASLHEGLAHAYGYRYWDVPDLTVLPSTRDLPPVQNIPPEYWVRRADGVPVRSPSIGMYITGLPRERGIGMTLWPGFKGLLPPGARNKERGYREVRGPHGQGSLLILPNGSRIHFASAEQDPLSFESFILDWVAVDEPIPKRIYSAVWVRLTDYMGNMWFTLTPIEMPGGHSPAWMHALFIESDDPDLFHIVVNQKDNPFLTESQREEMEKGGFTEAERAARVEGRFQFLGNRALPTFSPTVHVCEPFLTEPDWVHGLTVDPHHRRPAFMLWWAVDPRSKVRYYIREWPEANFFGMRSGALTPLEYARLIRELEGRRPSTVKIVDPRFGKTELSVKGRTITSWMEDMAQLGPDMVFDANVPGIARIETGLQRIRDRLFYDPRYPISPTNQPLIQVFSSCTNLITAATNIGYRDRRGDDGGVSEDLDETYKDPIDCLRYTELYEYIPSDIEAHQPISIKDLEAWQEQ